MADYMTPEARTDQPSDERGYSIQIMSVEAFRDWHQRARAFAGKLTPDEEIRQFGAPFAFVPDKGFRWTCPDCALPYLARTGAEAISGWDNPQWVLDGVPGSPGWPTASPSLGCTYMKDGPGHHWWLRSGRLVPA